MKYTLLFWGLLLAGGAASSCTTAPPASRGRTLSPDHEAGEPRRLPPGALDTTATDTIR